MNILGYIALAIFVLWIAFIYTFDQDPDTLRFSLRPWAKKVWEWWKK